MKLRISLYHLLVNRVPAIQKEYHKIRLEKSGIMGRIYAWGMLVWMNLCWLFGSRKLERQMYAPDSNKKARFHKAESELSLKETPQELVEQLLQADVISFDIFDTLIFRPVSAPADLFFFVGEKLHFMDFERIRKEMEHKARQKAYQESGSYEVTLDEIYEEIQKWTGITKEAGMKAEIETELEFCYANPYMLEVYRLLSEKIKETKKQIICVSDMYLPSKVLKQILKKCGYTDMEEILVSCEYKNSKADGSLYQRVMKKYGLQKKYIHIGDNPQSDSTQAKKNGWNAVHYSNVNIAGMPYRAEDMSKITGSCYRGMVNGRIHNGIKSYKTDYELGYIYGGIFVVGYCQFIHEYVKKHPVDKILFFARDGGIIRKVYEDLYPEESFKCEYVYWSRMVAVKLMAKYDRYDYFRRFIDHKVNQGISIKDIYQSMGLEDMTPQESEEYLTQQNALRVKEELIEHWQDVIKHYGDLWEAGRRYYSKVLKECKNALTVDVGWAGSGAIALDTMVQKEWNLECEIIGMVAGTNTCHNAEADAAESFLFSGKIVSYLYSQEQNREYWKWHNPAKNHNLLVELLLSEEEGSLKDMITKGEEGYEFCFKTPDVPLEKTKQIQQGILDFAKDWRTHFPDTFFEKHQISGSDAYAVLKILLQSEKNPQMEVGI